jgi:hypothetical protein
MSEVEKRSKAKKRLESIKGSGQSRREKRPVKAVGKTPKDNQRPKLKTAAGGRKVKRRRLVRACDYEGSDSGS